MKGRNMSRMMVWYHMLYWGRIPVRRNGLKGEVLKREGDKGGGEGTGHLLEHTNVRRALSVADHGWREGGSE